VGWALKELGIQMIPAYSPQGRGRSERRLGTWLQDSRDFEAAREDVRGYDIESTLQF